MSDLGFIDWLMTERSLVGLVGLDQVLEGIAVLGKLFGRDLCVCVCVARVRRGEWECCAPRRVHDRTNVVPRTHARTFS